MKKKAQEFIVCDETSLIGFEDEIVYKVVHGMTNLKICNISVKKDGNICVNSVCCAEIDTLTKALQFAKQFIQDECSISNK